MSVRKTTAKRILAAALSLIVAAAFTFAMPDEAYAAKAKKCKIPKITSAKSAKCCEITLKYKPAGKGEKPSVYFVYVKAPGGKYKLAAKTKKKTLTVKKLKADTKYTIRVRTAKAYKQKQWYNKKTKKWQNKKPKKKYRGDTRKVTKYKWYSKYCTVKTVKTKKHNYNMTTTQPTFTKDGSKSGACKWCKKKAATSHFGTAGCEQDLAASVSLMQKDGLAGVYLTWTAASGATGYMVERSENDGAYTDIFYSGAARYFDAAVQEGVKYTYRITAYTAGKPAGYGDAASQAEITIDAASSEVLLIATSANKAANPPVIVAPKIKSVTQTHITATVKWDAVAKAKKYAVYCGEEKLAETTKTSYTATDLTPKTDYVFRVEAIRDSITSARSGSYAITTTSVPTPKNITAEGGWDSVTLSWDPVEGAEGYYIRSDETDLKERVTLTSFTATGLEPNARYTFYVQAYLKKTYSTLTAGQIKTKTGFQAPENLGAISITQNSAILTWDPVDGADSYRIYKENGTSVVNTTSECSYKISGLDGNKTYTYYVAAGIQETGTYGLLDDDNKVSFTTVVEQEGFTPIPDIKLTYGSATFYLGQKWTSSLESKLKAASNGFEKVTRPGFAYEMLNYNSYDATEYMFDIDDYDNYLSVTVASNNQIIQWKTNGPVFGTYYGQDVVWGDDTANYPYGRRTGYRTTGSACNNIFTDIDRGDTVLGGFGFRYYPDTSTIIVENEKRVGYHCINAYRKAAGLSILEYSDALDGKNYKWSGTANGKQWTNVRYGMQPFAETIDANRKCVHETQNMQKGPLAGQSGKDRDKIIEGAYKDKMPGQTLTVMGENCATGGIGESCLGAYMKTNEHLVQIVSTNYNMIGLGISGEYNTQTYNYYKNN